MKIFISWSGELSKSVAETLKKWLPCILQTIEVFYSPEDIEKGENWDQKLTSELSESKYGIICLTPENISAPWIHFEAGALAKSLDSRVSALLININPSDIKGPLSRYQATKIERDDFYHLIQSINNNSDAKIDEERLTTTFDAIWPKLSTELSDKISNFQSAPKSSKKANERTNTEALEEILQLVRKQNYILSSPETLFPEELINSVIDHSSPINSELINNILSYYEYVYSLIQKSDVQYATFYFSQLDTMTFINSLQNYISPRSRQVMSRYNSLRRRYLSLYDIYGQAKDTD